MIAKKLGLDIKQKVKKYEIIAIINDELSKRKIEKEKSKTDFELNGIIVLSRDDGYINATQLCKAGNKKFSHWNSLDNTKYLLNELSRSAGIPADLLIQSITGGKNEDRKTWIHPDLAVQLAQWISPIFALKVSRWIRELAMTGKVLLGEEKNNDELLKLQKEIKLVEIKYTKLLKKRNYHKFKQGPVFYIISDSDGKSMKYKVGIDLVDVNVRLQQHRSTTPAIKLEYLLYTHKASLIEEGILELYKENKKSYLNHEWIYDIDIKHIIGSVDTFVKFLGICATKDENILEYNKHILEDD